MFLGKAPGARLDILPKSGAPTVVEAFPYCGVFVKLNISARYWSFARSKNWKFLPNARSALCCVSNRMFGTHRGALPIVYAAGCVTAAVLNQRSGLRLCRL